MTNRVETIAMNAMEQLKNISEEYDRVKKEAMTKMKDAFTPAFQEFFEKYPQIQYVYWTQYTPYFNDGDPCEFGVNEKSISLDEHTEDFDEEAGIQSYMLNHSLSWYKEHNSSGYYDSIIKALENEELTVMLKSAFKDLGKFDQIPDEVYQALGEGLVVVSRNGIDIREYEHE